MIYNYTNNEIFIYMSNNIKQLFNKVKSELKDKLTEIRLIKGGPLLIKSDNKRFYLGVDGISTQIDNAYIVSEDDMSSITELITGSSVYSYDKFINQGFLTLPGGHRVGIVGNCIVNGNKICNVKEYNSFVFRITHQIIGAADIIFDEIYSGGEIKNTLIVSPPACGKTTLLRDIARSLNLYKRVNRLITCAVIDERYELAATHNGKSLLNIGPNNFVISGCKKNIAIPLVVRSMSPDVIITDEMTDYDDFLASKYAHSSGVKIIASVHGSDEYNNELKNFDVGSVFEKIIVLNDSKGPGTIHKIMDGI